MIDVEKKINEYKEEKKSKSVFNQINETFWTDIEIGEKGNKQFDKWAELYLKEKKTIWDTVKISFLELKLSIFDKDFSKFKEELDNLKNELQLIQIAMKILIQKVWRGAKRARIQRVGKWF